MTLNEGLFFCSFLLNIYPDINLFDAYDRFLYLSIRPFLNSVEKCITMSSDPTQRKAET